MNEQAHRYEDKLLELAYGELEASEAKTIEAHVQGCARCATALQKIQGVRRQMSVLAPEPAPDAGLESLLAYAEQAARRAQAGPEPKKGIRRWAFALVGGTSLAAVLIAVSVVSLRTQSKLEDISPEAMKRAVVKEEMEAQYAPVGGAAPEPAPAAAKPMPPPPSAMASSSGGGGGAMSSMSATQAPEPNAPRDLQREMAKRAVRRDRAAVGGKIADRDGDQAARAEEPSQRLALKDDSNYRQSDRADKMQNIVPGMRSVPVVPNASAAYVDREQEAAAEAQPSKKAPRSDDEASDSLFGSGSRGGGVGESAGGLATGSSAGVLAETSEAKEKKLEVRQKAKVAATLDQASEGSATKNAAPVETERAAVAAAPRMAPPPPASAPAPAPPPAALASPSRKGTASPAPRETRPSSERAPSTREAPPSGEAYLQMANRNRGTDDEIAYLIGALSAGVSGESRLEALERLCKRLVGNDPRSLSYCNTWQREARTAAAEKYAREAKERWGRPAESLPASMPSQAQ
jgi:hypothetical protein